MHTWQKILENKKIYLDVTKKTGFVQSSNCRKDFKKIKMWMLHFLFIDASKLFEFALQFIIFYNFFQILKQKNFYIMLSYFFSFILYLGVVFIMYNCDIAVAMLWIIYGGVIVIFFVYSLMWFEVSRYNWGPSMPSVALYSLIVSLFIFFIYFFSLDFDIFNYLNDLNFYVDTRTLALNFDLIKELQLIGDGLLFHTSLLFLLSMYFLFFGCLSVVVIILISKRLNKFNSTNLEVQVRKNLIDNLLVQKHQEFFIQDIENTFLTRSVAKHNRLSSKFHKIN